MFWALNSIVLGLTGSITIGYIICLFSAQMAALIMTFLYYLRPAEKAVYPYPIVMVGLIIATLTLVMHRKPYSSISTFERKDTLLFVIMQLYLLFNILLYNRWTIIDLYQSYIIPAAILFFLISEYATSIKQLRLLLLSIGFPALIICADSLHVHFMAEHTSSIWLHYHLVDSAGGARLINLGWWDNPNKLAYLSNLGFLCFLISGILSSGAKRLMYFSTAGIFLPTLFLTGSRGALLQLCVSCFFFFIKSKKNTRTVIIAASAIFIAFTYLSALSPDREYAEGSTDERIEILLYAKEVFKSHPIFGVGFKLFPEYNPFRLVTHNTFAQLLVELGLVGTIIFFFMVKRMFSGTYLIIAKSRDNKELSEIHTLSKGIFAISIGAFVYYIFGNQLLDFMFCTIIGMLVAAKRAYELHIHNSDSETSG